MKEESKAPRSCRVYVVPLASNPHLRLHCHRSISHALWRSLVYCTVTNVTYQWHFTRTRREPREDPLRRPNTIFDGLQGLSPFCAKFVYVSFAVPKTSGVSAINVMGFPGTRAETDLTLQSPGRKHTGSKPLKSGDDPQGPSRSTGPGPADSREAAAVLTAAARGLSGVRARGMTPSL